MPLDRPEEGWVWLHVPRREGVEVVVLGDIHTWWAHFARVPGLRAAKAVRCLKADGAPCEWCDREIGRRARYVFPVRAGDVPRLVELGRVQYPELSMIYGAGRWLGARLRLEKEWDAPNARIRVTYLGREVITTEAEVDVGVYVSQLGFQELRTIKPPMVGADPPSKPSGNAVAPGAATRRNAWRDHAE